VGRTEDLEDELRASWNEGTLAVYADHLQAIGDPRGELISLDLRRDDGVEARRGELLRTWFSPLPVWWDADDRTWYAGDRAGRTWLSFERGLVEAVLDGDDLSALLQFFKHPSCTYLRRLAVSARTVSLRTVLAAFVRRDHHWLGALALRRSESDGTLVCSDTGAFVASTPTLELLEVAGRRILGELNHPALRELVIDGYDAIELANGSPMSAVTTLDYATPARDANANNGVAWLIRARRFPALRRLRLSRHEPVASVFASLQSLDVVRHLTHLDLPGMRTRDDVRRVQAALDIMHGLVEITFARSYAVLGDLGADLEHPSARLRLPPPVPWPPPDDALADRVLEIEDLRIEGSVLAAVMEDQFDGLPDDIQGIWLRFWKGLYLGPSLEHGLDRGFEQTFRADHLLIALDAVVFDRPEVGWLISQLRAELQKRSYEVRMRWL
jgi:hypothetical protein